MPEGAAPRRPAACQCPHPCPHPSPAAVRACSAATRSRACARAGGPAEARARGRRPLAEPALDFLKMARVRLPPASGAGAPPSTPPPPPSCSPSSPVLLGALPKDRPTCPCLSVVPGPCGSAGPGAPVCWEMLRGRVPPHSPSPLALACLLGPCPRRVDSCPPRSLSARWWRTSSAGCPVLWAVSFVLHPPFPADQVVPFVFTAVSDAGAVPGHLVTLEPRS